MVSQLSSTHHRYSAFIALPHCVRHCKHCPPADEQQAGEGPDEDILPSVSLDDDDGSSGVGLAAAAAVSAAMARAWATAASREQRAVAAAAGGGQGGGKVAGREPGGSSSGRAGFRLVATVTNKMGEPQPAAV
jgi:hypothetical protein